jgi:hypothetical protein
MSIVHDVTRNVKKNRIFKIRYLIEAVEEVCDILDYALCLALKEENSNISNEDIRDRVMKDCISLAKRYHKECTS